MDPEEGASNGRDEESELIAENNELKAELAQLHADQKYVEFVESVVKDEEIAEESEEIDPLYDPYSDQIEFVSDKDDSQKASSVIDVQTTIRNKQISEKLRGRKEVQETRPALGDLNNLDSTTSDSSEIDTDEESKGYSNIVQEGDVVDKLQADFEEMELGDCTAPPQIRRELPPLIKFDDIPVDDVNDPDYVPPKNMDELIVVEEQRAEEWLHKSVEIDSSADEQEETIVMEDMKNDKNEENMIE